MPKQILIEKEGDQDDIQMSPQGPFRKYQPFDMYWRHGIGRLSISDMFLSLNLATSFYCIMRQWHLNSVSSALSDVEQEIFEAVDYYKQGKFYLGALPPFGLQFYSMVPLEKELMRTISLLFGSFTLSMLYLILRRTNVASPFAVASVVCIGYLPLYQREVLSVSVDPLQWFFLSVSFYSWQSIKGLRPFQGSWYYHLFLLSISLGLGASTKFIGCFTWIWVCLLALYQFWKVIGDVKLSSSYLRKYGLCNILFLGIIPLSIFTSSYISELSVWTEDSPEFSRYMSPNFKAFLRGPVEQPKYLYYGSIIIIRHLESMGGYLHSHNHTYRTGSHEQQVTLTQLENDPNNKWKVEYPHAGMQNTFPVLKVQDFSKIRLRHVMTGKLLRASSAKPPVTEQDYDSEISCTGDAEYAGQADEMWSILSVGDALHSPIEPLKSVIKLVNEGQQCTMIAHDIRLPNWGFKQQEVLCLQTPTMSRSLFQIETVHFNSSQEIEYDIYNGETRTTYMFGKLLLELLQKQYKYNYYEKNYGLEGDYSPEKWPFTLTNEKYVDNIWIFTLLSLLIFVAHQAIQAFKWNPWNVTSMHHEKPLYSRIYEAFGTDCLLGWFLHYYPFTKTPHDNQDIVLYIPSIFMGQLLLWQTFNTWYKWHYFTVIGLCIYMVVVVYYIG